MELLTKCICKSSYANVSQLISLQIKPIVQHGKGGNTKSHFSEPISLGDSIFPYSRLHSFETRSEARKDSDRWTPHSPTLFWRRATSWRWRGSWRADQMCGRSPCVSDSDFASWDGIETAVDFGVWKDDWWGKEERDWSKILTLPMEGNCKEDLGRKAAETLGSMLPEFEDNDRASLVKIVSQGLNDRCRGVSHDCRIDRLKVTIAQ